MLRYDVFDANVGMVMAKTNNPKNKNLSIFFINLAKDTCDFSHERNWRLPKKSQVSFSSFCCVVTGVYAPPYRLNLTFLTDMDLPSIITLVPLQ